MAVLIEAISIVIRADALIAAYPGGWDSYVRDVPNATMCADNELVRIGFMSPVDAESYIKTLSTYGLEFLVDGKARDLAVVDQLKGPLAPCDWIECGHINLVVFTQRR